MKLNLQEIERVHTITKKDFIKNYFKPQKPVVIENLIEDWGAHKKWSLDYMKEVAGDIEVPLYDDRPISHEKKFGEAHAAMKMSEYVDLLRKEPTKYRIFLWNILKEVKELQQDYSYPEIGLFFLKKLPFLFFGGTNSFTFMHYDIDLANIIHVHFEGKKKCILFDQKQNKYLYKVPHALNTRQDIDFNDPDFEKWPLLKKAKGHITHLEHGQALYIPEGYWHYMRYITPGFSISLRAIPEKPKNLIKAFFNVFVMRKYDNALRKLRGQKWIDWKNEQALIRAKKVKN